MTDALRAADELLQATLSRQAIEHENAAVHARMERRAVWLRLHEVHGLSYEALATITGFGTTTLHTELRRARGERA